MKCLVILIVLMSSPLLAEPAKILRGNGSVGVAEVIKHDQCTANYLKQSSERYLASEKAVPVVWVGFFTDPAVALDVMAGEGRTEVGFEYWRKMHVDREASTRSGTCGELLKVAGRATLRLTGKTASENPSDVPITGKSVFFWDIGGKDLELVHVAFSEMNTGKRHVEKHFFFTTKGDVDAKLGEKVLAYLSREVGDSYVTVQLRREDYFIGSLKYPWVNPFIPDSATPSWEAFQKSPEIYCRQQSGQKPCMPNVSAIVPK